MVLITLAGLGIGYPSSYLRILSGVGVIMVLQSTYVYLRSHFSALGQYNKDSWFSALDKLLMTLFIGYFLYVIKEVSLSTFIGSQIAALLICIGVVGIALSKQFSLGVKFSLEKSRALLQKTLPFAVVFILMTLYTRMDGVMLERLLDDNAKSAGIYATAYRLLDAANILGYLFAMLLLPMFASVINQEEKVLSLVQHSTGILLTLATITSAMCWFYAADIMPAIYRDVSEQNIVVFRFLMASFWFMSMAYLFGALITASGRLRIFNWIFVVGIFMNWGLNLYLIPKSGAAGAAIATLATQSFVFLGQFILARSMFSLTYPISYIFKTVIFILFSFVLFYILSENLTILWLFEAAIGVFILLLVSILFGFLRLNSVGSDFKFGPKQ